MKKSDFEKLLTDDVAAQKRILRYAATGASLFGHFVSAEKLRQVVMETDGLSDTSKQRVVADLERGVIKGASKVEAVILGMFMPEIARYLTTREFALLHNRVRDLNVLPLIESNGRVLS